MSQASRQRQLERLLLHKWRGHPTWDSFRAWQATEMAKWRASADFAVAEAQRLAWRAAKGLDTAEWVPMLYPEPVNDSS